MLELYANAGCPYCQKVLKKMKDEGETCDCIRCREIKGKNDQNRVFCQKM